MSCGMAATAFHRAAHFGILHGARGAADDGLQIQEPTLRSFFDKISGALARGTGFLARFLVAWPESTQGTRQIHRSPRRTGRTWPHSIGALPRF
jgi:hypothetical protein